MRFNLNELDRFTIVGGLFKVLEEVTNELAEYIDLNELQSCRREDLPKEAIEKLQISSYIVRLLLKIIIGRKPIPIDKEGLAMLAKLNKNFCNFLGDDNPPQKGKK